MPRVSRSELCKGREADGLQKMRGGKRITRKSSRGPDITGLNKRLRKGLREKHEKKRGLEGDLKGIRTPLSMWGSKRGSGCEGAAKKKKAGRGGGGREERLDQGNTAKKKSQKTGGGGAKHQKIHKKKIDRRGSDPWM